VLPPGESACIDALLAAPLPDQIRFSRTAFRHTHTHTPTHTQPFNGPLSGVYPSEPVPEKVKPIWILLKQETASGSGISLAICKSAPRSRQTTTPAPHHSVFYRPDAFLPPNQQRQSTEGIPLSDTVIILRTRVRFYAVTKYSLYQFLQCYCIQLNTVSDSSADTTQSKTTNYRQ